jgi:hypothetical protein
MAHDIWHGRLEPFCKCRQFVIEYFKVFSTFESKQENQRAKQCLQIDVCPFVDQCNETNIFYNQIRKGRRLREKGQQHISMKRMIPVRVARLKKLLKS